MALHLMRSVAIQHKLGELLAQHMAAANMLGRTQVVDDVRRKTGRRVQIATSSRFHSRLVKFSEDAASQAAQVGALLPGSFSTSLPPDRAAEYLRGLTPVTRDTFDGLSAQYKRDAFTVSGTADVRLIQKIRDELATVLHQGATKGEFQQAVAKLTTDAGVEKLSAFTLDTVFTTNMQKAYSLGRYEQLTDPDVVDALPFWQYLTVGDDRVRPEHAVLDYFTARAQDPVWNKIYPPNGFNCRCIVIALLDEEAPEGASEPGYSRLPALAVLKVPQSGFTKVFAPPLAA